MTLLYNIKNSNNQKGGKGKGKEQGRNVKPQAASTVATRRQTTK
jgi:hypothetical protein